ncbi:MAG: peptidylprolyl isomerase [Deltaproteobacteria bacterium]|nr:peptidylprolyl isomerase [Deltaproteobacteria bacterium]
MIFLLTVAGFVVPVFAQTKNAPVLSREKIGYALGVGIGRNMKNLDLDIDPDMIVRGIRDAVRGQIGMSDQDIKAALDNYDKDVMTKLGQKNRREGEAFLKENKQRKAIVTLPSGLQYWVLKEGTGKVPKMNDLVTLHYQARLLDGYEFENSHWKNKPAETVVNKTLKGWSEALTRMPAGSTWRLYIPSELAYGEGGAGQIIGPNAVLICDLELISVK